MAALERVRAGRPGRVPAHPAVGRPAAAGGDRPGAHGRAEPAAVRRADRQPRLEERRQRARPLRASCPHDWLTLAVITHDDHVASRAHRRVRIIDGVLHEVRIEPAARTNGREPAAGRPRLRTVSCRPRGRSWRCGTCVEECLASLAGPPGPGRADRPRHGGRRGRARRHPRALEDGREPDRRPLRRAGRHRHRRHAEDRQPPAGAIGDATPCPGTPRHACRGSTAWSRPAR